MGEYDFKRIFVETVMGVVLSTILQAIFFLYLHHQPYIIIFTIHFMNVLSIIALSFIAPFLAMSYTFGWTFGTYMLQSIRIIDLTEHIIYLVILIPVLYRLVKGVT